MAQQHKGFLDRVLQFMGIQEESDDSPRAEEHTARTEVAATAPRPQVPPGAMDKRKGRLVSLPSPGRSASQVKVAVVKPQTYEEVEQIADHLKDRQPVIVSLENVDKAVSRRIIDFVSGTTYALDGSIHRIGEEIFLLAPINVSIDADMARSWNDEELFS